MSNGSKAVTDMPAWADTDRPARAAPTGTPAPAICAVWKKVRREAERERARDPALLFFKGYHALQAYRIAHQLYEGREVAALLVQSRMAQVYRVDIHTAARIGKGIMIDHGTGVG